MAATALADSPILFRTVLRARLAFLMSSWGIREVIDEVGVLLVWVSLISSCLALMFSLDIMVSLAIPFAVGVWVGCAGGCGGALAAAAAYVVVLSRADKVAARPVRVREHSSGMPLAASHISVATFFASVIALLRWSVGSSIRSLSWLWCQLPDPLKFLSVV